MKSHVYSGAAILLALICCSTAFALPQKTGDDDDIDDLIVERAEGATADNARRANQNRDGLEGSTTRSAPADAVSPASGNWGEFVTVTGPGYGGADGVQVRLYPNDDDSQLATMRQSATLYSRQGADVIQIAIPQDPAKSGWSGDFANGVVRIYVYMPGQLEPVLAGRYTVGNPSGLTPGGTMHAEINRMPDDAAPPAANPPPITPGPTIATDPPPFVTGSTAAATPSAVPGLPAAEAPPASAGLERFANTPGATIGEQPVESRDGSAPAPVITAAGSEHPGTITVTWSPVANATRYEVHALESGRQQSAVLELAADAAASSYTRTITGLASDLPHEVWVVAYSPKANPRPGLGTEDRGASALQTVQVKPAHNPASLRAELQGTDAVLLSWDEVIGATGYRLEGPYLPATETTATSLTLGGVEQGEFQWQVYATFGKGIYNTLNPATANLQVGTREEWVDRAYNNGIRDYAGIEPDAARWKRLAMQLTGGYDELEASFESIWVVNYAYWYLLQREATAEEANPLIARMKVGEHWNGIWRTVAQSEEVLRLRGSWAPAPFDSVSVARQAFSQPGLQHAENCFGAMGPHCDGLLEAETKWTDSFTMPDGTKFAYVTINVSVGSILHDNACLKNNNALHCELRAWDWYIDVWTIDPLAITAKAMMPGALEWNKAVWNAIDQRRWRQRYGPYPVIEVERRTRWYDDLTYAMARPAWMAPVLGMATIPLHTESYKGSETRTTRLLAAPVSTLLDYRDGAYCKTGTFSANKQQFGKVDAGLCR